MIKERVWTKQATGLPYEALFRRLFLHECTEESRWLENSGRFRGPSGRAPFSDEGGFTFSAAPFEGTLHEGLKGASPSEGFKRLHLRKEGLEGGFKGASRGLEGGFKGASRSLKPSEGEGGFGGLEGGLKGARRGLHLRKASRA